MIAGNLKVIVCFYPSGSGSKALRFLLYLAGDTCLHSYYIDTGCFPESSFLPLARGVPHPQTVERGAGSSVLPATPAPR